jgi:hypothetical protein
VKVSIIELKRLLGVSMPSSTLKYLIEEVIAAREVIEATERLLARPEVKAAAHIAPGLAPDINRLQNALKEYKAK